MTRNNNSIYHTVEDEWLATYCAGGLSAAKRLVLNCQAAINPHLADRINTFESLGGVMLETAVGEQLSDNFMSRVFAGIESAEQTKPEALETDKALVEYLPESWVPSPLANFLKTANMSLNWKNMGFGISRIPLLREGREKLYLLKSKPGVKMPVHSHHGEEWALILQGGYHVDGEGYSRGDVHREDENCTHRPIVDDHGEACITLVASEGGLKFSNPVLGLLKPILGI